MTELEAIRIKLKCLEMVEGTGVSWWEVVKVGGRSNNAPKFKGAELEYELALGIVEGKPVWEGDELYTKEGAAFIVRADTSFCSSDVSWNPPKPKTVMVEFLAEDAARLMHCLDLYEVPLATMRAKEVLSKALENLK